MKIQVEVVSTETIKPASPTPDHLRKYQLSFLDQLSPPVFMPLSFFFAAENNLSEVAMSNQLKKSLSKVLTQFYPLAGRIMDNFHVDCNDTGVAYFEARANCCLSDFIRDPIPGELNKFFPYKFDDIRNLPMVVQVTFFNCGGMALSIALFHKLADALSFVMFVKNWAATARGGRDSDLPCPIFESSNIFPQKNNITGFKPSTKEKIVTSRFVFTASKLATLRDNYTDDKNGVRPTRIEALSAFIWRRFMVTTQAKEDPDHKIYTLLHSVNLRTRTDPPLSENYFGNFSRVAIAVADMESDQGQGELYGIVTRMRKAISKIDGAYVKKLQDKDGNHSNLITEIGEIFSKGKEEVVSFNFSSLCNFPLYECDFGWGKPVWVASANLLFKVAVFMDAPSGDGIEVWVNLKDEDMAKFEVDKELLALVSSTTDRCC